jgi:hypothetical protein
LNPRYPLRYVRFRGGSFQPLTHLSGKQLPVASNQLPVKKQIPRRFAPRNDKRLILSTAISKKRLQQFGAAAGEHPAPNLNLVVHLRMIHNLHHRVNRPGFGIVRTIYEAMNAGVNHCTGAHGARLNCNKQFAFLLAEAMITKGRAGLA